MLTRLVLWTMLASPATLFPAQAFAQPKSPFKLAVNTGASAQIIPVNLTNEQVAATVNGEKILVGEVRKILDVRPPSVIVLTESQKKDSRQAALEVLIEDALMRQYLGKQVTQVSQADFDKEFKELSDALVKLKKSFAEFLAESGQTEEQLRRDIIARLQWRTMLVRLLPEENAKKYYDENKVFFDKIYVRASHILIKLPPNPTREQRDKATQQLLVWRQEILLGKAKFEEIAKIHSQCPSKDKDGDIGQFPYKFVVLPEFAGAAFAMREGEISDVVQTVSGLHLIKVTERLKGEPSDFDAVKQAVREVWAQDEDLYQRILTDQKKVVPIKIDLP